MRPAFILLLLAASSTAAERLMIVHKHDASVGFYDSTTGKLIQRAEVGTVPHEVALTPDSRLAVVTNYGVRSYTDASPGGNTVHLIDTVHMKPAGTWTFDQNTRPHGIERGASGRFFVTTDFPAAVLILNPRNGKIEGRFPLSCKLPHMLQLSGDEKRAYVACSGSGDLVVLDLSEMRELRKLPIGGVPMGLVLDHTGRWLYATNRPGNQVCVIDTQALSITSRIDVSGEPVRAHLTLDGKRLLVSTIGSGEVVAIDVARRTILHRFQAGARAEGLSVHPDGMHAYVSAQGDNKVHKFRLSDYKIVQTIETSERPDPIVVLPR
jgi:YVTN family beta-propeller protein